MKPNHPKVEKINIVMDCADAGILAKFYSNLLDWEWTHPQAGGWAAITSPDGMVIAFQEIEGYQPPVWPWESGKQAQMLHLDIWVAAEEMETMVAYAKELGATEAKEQYYTSSHTMLDPAGHPFCIDTDREEPA